MKILVIAILATLVIAGTAFYFIGRNSVDHSTHHADQPGHNDTTITSEDSRVNDHLKGSNQREQKDATGQDAVDVEIGDFYYGTSVLTIKVGTTVTWTNNGKIRHDVNLANSSPDRFPSSELLNSGESYSYTFQEPGSYFYFCSPHPTQMRAVVEVIE